LRDSLPIDMLLSAVSVLVVAQSSSEVPEGLMNNAVFVKYQMHSVLCKFRKFLTIQNTAVQLSGQRASLKLLFISSRL